MLANFTHKGLIAITSLTFMTQLSWAQDRHAEITGSVFHSLTQSADSFSKTGQTQSTELGEFHIGSETLHPIVQPIVGVIGDDNDTEAFSDKGLTAVPKPEIQTFHGTFAESSTGGKDFIRFSVIKDPIDGSQAISGIMERSGQIFSLASETSSSRLKDAGQASLALTQLSEPPSLSSLQATATSANASALAATESPKILTLTTAVRSELYKQVADPTLTEQQNIQRIRNKIVLLFDTLDAYTQRDLNIKLSLIYQLILTSCDTEACPYYRPIYSLNPLSDWLSELRPRKKANWKHTFVQTSSGGYGSSGVFVGGMCRETETTDSFPGLSALIPSVTPVPRLTYRYYANMLGTLLNASNEDAIPTPGDFPPYYFMTKGFNGGYPNTVDEYSPRSINEIKTHVSQIANATCLAPFGSPIFTQEPTNVTISTIPAAATFTVKAKKGLNFTGNLEFQWMRSEVLSVAHPEIGTPISGATSAQYDPVSGEYTSQYTLPVLAPAPNQSPAIWARVTATSGSTSQVVYSDPAILRVKAISPILTISSNPSNTSVTEGATVTFNVVPGSGGLTGITYRWMKQLYGQSAQQVPGGSSSSSYTTPSLTTADDKAQYFVEISTPYGTTTSNKIPVLVTRPCLPITIHLQPKDVLLTSSQTTAAFSTQFELKDPGSTANSQTQIRLCWRQHRSNPDREIEIGCVTRTGANIVQSSGYTGTISKSSNPDVPQIAPGMGVFARISYGSCPAVDTDTATVNAPPSLISQSSNITRKLGETATFSAQFQTWGFDTTYQWYKQRIGRNIFDPMYGATQPTHSYPVREGVATVVKVVAENAFGTIESAPIKLTISDSETKSLKSKSKAKKKPVKKKPAKKKPLPKKQKKLAKGK